MARALAVAVGFSSAAEIDAVNIRQATFRAMRRALAALAARPAYVVIDGNDLPQRLCCDGETIVKGDGAILSIAAASIVAKVARDRLMRRLAPPSRLWLQPACRLCDRSASRRDQAHRPCPYHRLSFSPFRPAGVSRRTMPAGRRRSTRQRPSQPTLTSPRSSTGSATPFCAKARRRSRKNSPISPNSRAPSLPGARLCRGGQCRLQPSPGL